MVPLPPILWARPPDGHHNHLPPTRATPSSHLTTHHGLPNGHCDGVTQCEGDAQCPSMDATTATAHGCDVQYPPYHGHDAPMPTNGRHDGYSLPPSHPMGRDALMATNGCHDASILRARCPMPTNGRHDGYSLFPSHPMGAMRDVHRTMGATPQCPPRPRRSTPERHPDADRAPTPTTP
jgi:hypothetical protein